MRETGLLAPHRVGRTAAKPHDGTITTDKVNEMWGTDMTQTITIREGRANVFVAVEHANSEVVDSCSVVGQSLRGLGAGPAGRNPAGRKPGSRNRLSEEVISSFLCDWRMHQDHALAKVRRMQPAVYCKLAVLLVPREQKVEHVNALTGLSDEQLEAMIAELEERIARRAAGSDAKLIEAVETTALPAPIEVPNRVMAAADTAVLGRDET